jgi:hypothetical protein
VSRTDENGVTLARFSQNGILGRPSPATQTAKKKAAEAAF